MSVVLLSAVFVFVQEEIFSVSGSYLGSFLEGAIKCFIIQCALQHGNSDYLADWDQNHSGNESVFLAFTL